MIAVKRWIHQLDSRFLQRKTTLKQTEERIEITLHFDLFSLFLVLVSIPAFYFTDYFIVKLACVAFTHPFYGSLWSGQTPFVS